MTRSSYIIYCFGDADSLVARDKQLARLREKRRRKSLARQFILEEAFETGRTAESEESGDEWGTGVPSDHESDAEAGGSHESDQEAGDPDVVEDLSEDHKVQGTCRRRY